MLNFVQMLHFPPIKIQDGNNYYVKQSKEKDEYIIITMTNKLCKYKIIMGDDLGYRCCRSPTHFAKTRVFMSSLVVWEVTTCTFAFCYFCTKPCLTHLYIELKFSIIIVIISSNPESPCRKV